MIPVTVLMLASAAGGAYAYERYRQWRWNRSVETPAKELQKDRAYAVQIVIDSSHHSWPKDITSPMHAGSLIRESFKTYGWSPLATARPRNMDQESRFFRGFPSEWFLPAVWTGTEKNQDLFPSWAIAVVPYLMPGPDR
jgi:hypothetical protein